MEYRLIQVLSDWEQLKSKANDLQLTITIEDRITLKKETGDFWRRQFINLEELGLFLEGYEMASPL